MRKAILLAVAIILCARPGMADEYAIIKESLFGAQKIEFYRTQAEALKHYNGEGKLYRMTRTEIPVRRTEIKKRVEVTEYNWTIDEKKPAKSK